AGVDLQKRLDSLEEGVFEDDALVAAYAAIEDAVEEGYFLSGGAGIKHTEAQAQWANGKAELYPSGSWIENEQKAITPEDYEMVGVPTPQLSSGSAMPAEAIHGPAGAPCHVPSQAAHGAGGLEFLRLMLTKEQAQNFSEMTSSVTILKDTSPEDAVGSTALASTDEMITAAGE